LKTDRQVSALDSSPPRSGPPPVTMGKRASGEGDGAPSPIDVHVGARIRQRRTALGMSQEKLGDALRLTFQQIQKYERGINRVGASRLYDLCRVFDVTADYFFEGLPRFEPRGATPPARGMPTLGRGAAENQEPLTDGPEAPPPLTPEEAELLGSFSRITDTEVRKRVLELVKSLSGASS
jgi:transcriptional regulator with XRE-family HTH domain